MLREKLCWLRGIMVDFPIQKSLCQDCRLAAGDTPTEKVWFWPWGQVTLLSSLLERKKPHTDAYFLIKGLL